MSGQSIRKCAYPSPAPVGTSPVSTASRLTLPNARSGTARTPPQFYLLERFHFSLWRTASITRRSQRFRFAGNRSIQNISAPLLAWQLHRSVSCSGSIGDFARFHAELRQGRRPIITPVLSVRGTRFRKSQPTAGGGL